MHEDTDQSRAFVTQPVTSTCVGVGEALQLSRT